jgi:signal transduction histidine kinase/ActR/RegA family two-component response regulator
MLKNYQNWLTEFLTQYPSSESLGVRKNIFHFIVLAAMVGTINFFVSIYCGVEFSAWCNIVLAVLAFSCIFPLVRGYAQFSRIVLIVGVNVILGILSIKEGLRSGDYMMFFPMFFSFPFLYLIEKISTELVIMFCFSIATVVIVVFFSPADSADPIIRINNDNSNYTNIVTAIILSLIFSVNIIRTNYQASAAISEEKNFFNAVFENAASAIFIVDKESLKIVNCNATATKLLLAPKSNFIDLNLGSFFENLKANVLTVDAIRTLVSEHRFLLQQEFTKKDATPFFGALMMEEFKTNDRSFIRLTINDISQQKAYEKELVETREKAIQASAAKTWFLSNMSHEIRTPLNGIIGISNILLKDEHLDSQEPNFMILRNSSEHLLNLVNDVLDYSKLDEGKVELDKTAFNLKTLLRHTLRPFENQAKQKKLTLQMHIDEDLEREVYSDKMRLTQVLNNLVSNAIKFTEHGSVSLEARVVAQTRHKVEVKFLVSDTGIGILPEKQKMIFDRFSQAQTDTQRKFGGTGLGLAITERLLQLFDSNMQLESEYGKGSSFSFTIAFPLSFSKTNFIDEGNVKKLGSLDKINVLVAEDNKINMLVLTNFLDSWKVRYIKAINGKQAVDFYDQNTFDLVLMDLEMPEMDGFEATKLIRQKNPSAKVIAFTAAVFDNMQTELKEKGFSDYMQKPFRPAELHKKLTEHTETAVASV